MLIITLSTIPSRFDLLGPTLDSLLAQRQLADKICVYIPKSYRRFPDWDGVLPQVPAGVEICRCDHDLGPATKVLAAASEHRGKDVDLVFCDDDQIYDRNWLATFRALRAKHTEGVLATLGFQTHLDFGGSGSRVLRPRAVRRWRATDVRFQLRMRLQDFLERRLGHPHKPISRRVFKRSGYVECLKVAAV